MVGKGGSERAFERASHILSGTIDSAGVVPAALRLNRVFIASLLVLVLSGLAFGVAAGGFGISEAAAAVPGQVTGPIGSAPPNEEVPPPDESQPAPDEGSGSPAPGSEAPLPSESATAAPSFEPLPSP
jgi:hypothetical protein